MSKHRILPPIIHVNEKPLVEIHHGKPTTTSLQIAETFGKKHSHVLRSVDEMDCSEDFRRSNFGLASYLDKQGKERPMYYVSRDGFTFLAMGFRGEKSAAFKEAYICQFNRMEKKLSQRHDPFWKEARSQGKQIRRQETDVIQEFVGYAKVQGSQNAHWYYRNLTDLAYRVLDLQDYNHPIRDLLTPQQSAALTLIEHSISETIRAAMAAGLHYKSIYRAATVRVMELAIILTPAVRLLAA